MPARRLLILVIVSAAVLSGCPSAPTAPEPRFPAQFVDTVLDAEPAQAAASVAATWPGAAEVPGAFQRFDIDASEILEEVILFRNVRTGRVDSVILKYKADLGPQDRRAVFAAVAHPEFEGVDEVREVPWRRGMRLRMTPSDRFGRLTLTVEPVPEPR